MFTILIAFMLNFNNEGLTAKTIGQYYEPVRVEYDAPTNRTYGVFVRYNVAQGGSVSRLHSQLRSVVGNATKADLIKQAPHDASIVLIGE